MTNDAEVTSELEKLIICALSTNFMQNLLVNYVAFRVTYDERESVRLRPRTASKERSSFGPGRAEFLHEFLFIYAEFYDVDVMISTKKKASSWTRISFTLLRHLYFRLVTTSVGKLVERHLNYSRNRSVRHLDTTRTGHAD